MRRIRYLAPVVATLSFVVSTAALAQPRDAGRFDRDGRGGRGDDRHVRPPPPRAAPGPAYGVPGHRGPDYRGPVHGGPVYGGPVYRGPVYGPEHRFARGERLPPPYRSRYYVVGDWRAHRLHLPPPGYQWVQWGADYLLVAIATGLIAEVILGR